MSCVNRSSVRQAQGANNTSLYAGPVHFVLRPTTSEKSKIFRKEPRKSKGHSDVTRSSRPGRSKGKLSRLMDMPMDIFLEIMALLHPRDLLNLARVSRHFRAILMSRSSKGMWMAARKNAQDMPPPPDSLSEPKYASFLFEHDCQACGVPRAGMQSFLLSLRLCSACWKENICIRRKILQNHKELKPIADTIFPLVFGLRSGYFTAEVQAVAEHYCTLSGTEKDSFVEQRRAYMKTIEEHGMAVLAWQQHVKDERNLEGALVAAKREKDILARLIEMGYSEGDFPENSYDSAQWKSLVSQPRELTEQIWKRILPKLQECISEAAEWRKWVLLSQRMKDAEDLLETCITELLLTCEKVLTTYTAIRESDEISNIIDDASTPATREDIEAILPDILKRQTDKNFARYMNALQQALSSDSFEGHGNAELQPLPDLDSAIALFPCPECDNEDVARNYTLAELVQHAGDTHLRADDNELPEALWLKRGILDRTHFHVDTVRKVLKMLELPEDTRYEDISGKVICLCGRFDFAPVQFSALIHHIKDSHCWYIASPSDRERLGGPDETEFYYDHDFDKFPPFLRLLRDGGSFASPELVVPEAFKLHA